MLNETHIRWTPILLIFLLAGCTSLLHKAINRVNSADLTTTEPERMYANYTSTYFSLEYPDTWDVEENTTGNGTYTVTFRSQREDQTDTILDSFSIIRWKGTKSIEELETFERRLMYEGERVTRNERIPWKGQDVLVMETEGPKYGQGPEVIFYRVTYVSREGWIYRIEYSIEKGKEEKFIPIMDRMLESLQWAPPANATPTWTPIDPVLPGSISNATPPAPDQVQDVYVPYTSSDFSINYPANWRVDERHNTTRITGFISPLENAADNLYDVFSVEVWESNATLEDLRTYERSLLYIGETITQEGYFTFKGSYNATYTVTERQLGTGEWIYYRAMYFTKDGHVYRLVYVYDQAKADRYGPIMLHMMDSFEAR